MDYDVIIAGGSFAGLAAAAQLSGKRVLLIEPHDIGAVQTSACGTLLSMLEAMGTLDSLLQVHDRLILHLGQCAYEYPTPYPFCTFDYRFFCKRLLEHSDAEILQASVLGHHGHKVSTTRGVFEAEILIDATGWRAALAATNSPHRAGQPNGRSFGLETTIPIAERGLHFYYEPQRLGPFNVGWIFPIGARSRAGVGSYFGQTQLGEALANFTRAEFGLSPDGRHGGYFTNHLRPATTDHVFRVGDAAGQCLPLTGEGIRPALYFGATAGRLARRVLDGTLRESDALHEYHKIVDRHTKLYRSLLMAQKFLPNLPVKWIEPIADHLQRPKWLGPLLHRYCNAFNPMTLV